MRGKNVNSQERLLIRQMHDEGISQCKIAKILGRSQPIIQYHLSNNSRQKRCNYNYCYYRIKKCGGTGMKNVIFRRNGALYMTSEENYNARIEDARKVTNLKDFNSFEEVVQYMCKWYNDAVEDDFVDMTGD